MTAEIRAWLAASEPATDEPHTVGGVVPAAELVPNHIMASGQNVYISNVINAGTPTVIPVGSSVTDADETLSTSTLPVQKGQYSPPPVLRRSEPPPTVLLRDPVFYNRLFGKEPSKFDMRMLVNHQKGRLIERKNEPNAGFHAKDRNHNFEHMMI